MMKEVGYPECNKVGQTYGWVLNLFGVKIPIIPKVRVEKVSYLFTRSARYGETILIVSRGMAMGNCMVIEA